MFSGVWMVTVEVFPSCPNSLVPVAHTLPSSLMTPIFALLVALSPKTSPEDISIAFSKYSVSLFFNYINVFVFVVFPCDNCPTAFNPLAHTVPSDANTTVL